MQPLCCRGTSAPGEECLEEAVWAGVRGAWGCPWSPLGLDLPLWEVQAYVQSMARLLAGTGLMATCGPVPAPGPLHE